MLQRCVKSRAILMANSDTVHNINNAVTQNGTLEETSRWRRRSLLISCVVRASIFTVTAIIQDVINSMQIMALDEAGLQEK